MPFKPIEIDINNYRFADEEPQPEQQPGYLQQAGSFAKNLLGTAVAAPAKLGETVASLTGGHKPYGMLGNFEEEYKTPEKIKPTSESIKETFGVKEPEGLASRAIHSTVENWPLLLLGGGSLAGKIGADLASSTGMHIAKDLGAGVVGQIGASVLAGKGFDKAAGALKGSAKIKDFTSKLYEQEKKLGSKISVSTDPFVKPLNNLYDNVQKKFVNSATFSDAAKNRSLENIKIASELIDKPNLKASDVFEVKKLLNEIWAPKNSIENRVYNDLRNVFKNELDTLAKVPANKKWGDSFKTADELYSISKWQSGFGRNLDQLANSNKIAKLISNPTAQAAVAALAGATLGTKAAAVTGGILAGKSLVKGGESAIRGGKFLKALMKSKDGQKLLWEIAADSAKDNTKAIGLSLNKLNKKADKWDEENPEVESTGGFKPIEIDMNTYQFAD